MVNFRLRGVKTLNPKPRLAVPGCEPSRDPGEALPAADAKATDAAAEGPPKTTG